MATIALDPIGLEMEVQPDGISLNTPTARVAVVRAPELTRRPNDLQWWLSRRDPVLVVTATHASHLFRVPLDTGVTKVAADLNRKHSDVLGDEVQFLSCRQAPDGGLLVLYESGLVCLDAHGKLRWHHLDNDVTARFGTIEQDHVCIERHLPFDRVGRTYLRLEDGREWLRAG